MSLKSTFIPKIRRFTDSRSSINAKELEYFILIFYNIIFYKLYEAKNTN